VCESCDAASITENSCRTNRPDVVREDTRRKNDGDHFRGKAVPMEDLLARPAACPSYRPRIARGAA
jgi:hypothetical protein